VVDSTIFRQLRKTQGSPISPKVSAPHPSASPRDVHARRACARNSRACVRGIRACVCAPGVALTWAKEPGGTGPRASHALVHTHSSLSGQNDLPRY
jgi:hypothetical protein